MTQPEPDITVKVDITNPGEFFACCGLLELADRLWRTAEGWFDMAGPDFCVHVGNASKFDAWRRFLEAFAKADVSNTMTPFQVQRRQELASMPKNERRSRHLAHEKRALDKLWRESPILIGAPFNVLVDWFLDGYGGGSSFKTWAGQQSVIDIFVAMKASLESDDLASSPSGGCFSRRSNNGSVPFNFDAMLGAQGSDRDMGFSRDPLQIPTACRPLVELLAFVGLQRCRPAAGQKRHQYRYSTWTQPMCPELAGVASSGYVPCGEAHGFEFRLLYRTKYLKSFLSATPIGV